MSFHHCRPRLWPTAILLLTACHADPAEDAGIARDGGRRDAGVVRDAAAGDAGADMDAGAAADGGALDGGASADAGSFDAGMPDAGSFDAGFDAGPLRVDAGPLGPIDLHVHIEISNPCEMRVTPTELTVPAGQSAFIDWHNHSVDYPVDVWMSYGGGYTDLAPRATWDERFEHCNTPLAHTEYADIDTACSGFRFLIHCQE
jgi:hypothetical protein